MKIKFFRVMIFVALLQTGRLAFVSSQTVKVDADKANAEALLPWSESELRANIKRASVVAHGHITAYAPPSFNEKEHTAVPEKTSLLIDKSLRGPFLTGRSLTYLCVCSGESSSTTEKMVGRDVIVFLSYDAAYRYWKPSSEAYRFDYSEALWNETTALMRRRR